MSDADGPDAKPAKKRRMTKGSLVDASVVVEGITELFKGTLSRLLNPEQVERAFAAAAQAGPFKGMLADVAGGRYKARGGAKKEKTLGPKPVRSTYLAFTTLAMAHLKAANREDLGNLKTVAQTWKKLPPSVRDKIEERLSVLKERYNEALAADKSGSVSLAGVLADLDREAGREPLDLTSFIVKYKDAEPQEEGKTLAKALPAPAATPSAGDKRKADGGGGGEKHHSHKKEKKEKKEKHHHHKKEKKKEAFFDDD